MRCEEARELLPAYLDGEVVGSDLVQHLATCDACRLELEGYRAVAAGLVDLRDAGAAPPPHLVERVVALIPAPSLVDRLMISVQDHPLAYVASLAGAAAGAAAIAVAVRRARRTQAVAA